MVPLCLTPVPGHMAILETELLEDKPDYALGPEHITVFHCLWEKMQVLQHHPEHPAGSSLHLPCQPCPIPPPTSFLA